MIYKIAYTIIILIVCIIVCFKVRKNENSLAFIIVTGIITAIIGNMFIPSDISVFDVFNDKNKVFDGTEPELSQMKAHGRMAAQ